MNGTEKVNMTEEIKEQIIEVIQKYGTGKDTLRCLGMATVEQPGPKEEMNLEDSKNFIQYEVDKSVAYWLAWQCVLKEIQWSLWL